MIARQRDRRHVVELHGRHRIAVDETGTLDATGPVTTALETIGRLHKALTGGKDCGSRDCGSQNTCRP